MERRIFIIVVGSSSQFRLRGDLLDRALELRALRVQEARSDRRRWDRRRRERKGSDETDFDLLLNAVSFLLLNELEEIYAFNSVNPCIYVHISKM